MCGIAGFISRTANAEHLKEVITLTLRKIAHRGEERFQRELLVTAPFGGGANRLAFTSGGQPQPCSSPNGRYKVFLNGEIYTYHDGLGVNRGGTSDTSALANAIQNLGVPAALEQCDGIYAVLVYDAVEQCLYLARDPFGIKPLYYSEFSAGLLCASEIKALVTHGFVSEVKHVEPGSILKAARDGRVQEVSRIDICRDTGLPPPGSAEVIAERLRDALLKSVKAQTRDGQRYAVFLSGGLDSSAVYVAAKEAGASVTPFVVGRTGASDVEHAGKLAEKYGDKLHVIPCPSEKELFKHIEETVFVCESFEPNVVRQSAVSLVLAKAVKSQGFRVALCGEGADELLGGYPESWVSLRDFGLIRRRLLADLHRTQLQRVDRANMRHTIEVRVPFLTREIATISLASDDSALFGDPANLAKTAKLPLRVAMDGLLPDDIRMRPKVVLSEGAGLRGNNPVSGMFADIAEHSLSDGEFAETSERFRDWGLTSKEQAYYFGLFRSFGFDRYGQAMKRVYANATATVKHRKGYRPSKGSV